MFYLFFFPSFDFFPSLEAFLSPFFDFPVFFCLSFLGESAFLGTEDAGAGEDACLLSRASDGTEGVLSGGGDASATEAAAFGRELAGADRGVSLSEVTSGEELSGIPGIYSMMSLISQFRIVQSVSRVWVDTCMFFFRRPICPALKLYCLMSRYWVMLLASMVFHKRS